MNLYLVNDDIAGVLYPEERVYVLTWAENAEEAIDIALLHFDANISRGECDVDEIDPQTLAAYDIAASEKAGIETRSEVCRVAGLREDGEEQCDYCGLAACGLSQYAVCDECQSCAECGHEEDCPELAERENQNEKLFKGDNNGR